MEFLTVKQLAKRWGYSRQGIEKLILRGVLKVDRMRFPMKIELAEIQRLEAEHGCPHEQRIKPVGARFARA